MAVSEMLRDVKEISPEKEQIEVEAFPTEARVGQKAQEQQHKLLIGEKHKPKSRQKEIEPGHDDCGEDMSSLHDATTSAYEDTPCQIDTDDDLSDEDHDFCMFYYPTFFALFLGCFMSTL